MTREEAIVMWVIPALENTWNEKKCDEILKALDQEPCDAVSREKVLQIVRAWFDRDAKSSELKNEIENLPSVTPAEMVGHWINHKDEHQCSQCREIVIADKDIWEEYSYDYCPNCGAKMEEVEG